MDNLPKNKTIGDNLIIAYSKINDNKYNKIMCSVSGGSDSDVILDICERVKEDGVDIDYVWFDTGLEYQATKNHLKYLENKYGIEIKPYKAIKPIPISCREYGQPFLSKKVAQCITRLQRHDFKWEDKSYGVLCQEYPKITSMVKWWCNKYDCVSFNIHYNKWLKEFMILNPPDFKISDKCCDYAKKKVKEKCIKEIECDLNIYGVRKAEKGMRQQSYKNCFDDSKSDKGHDNYRPIFWYSDTDKECYENHYDVIHSKCYTEYGLKRTGCAGCPFGRNFEEELNIIQKYEPKLYKAVNNIFGDSYEYTRKYKQFCNEMDSKYGSYQKYLREFNK